MKAEIVRADEIKAGDRIFERETGEIQKIESIYESSILRGWLIFRCDQPGPSYEHRPASLVCRVVPEPTEEREFWQVVNCGVRLDGERYDNPGDARIAANYLRQKIRDIEIEHVRITVLSREEVKKECQKN